MDGSASRARHNDVANNPPEVTGFFSRRDFESPPMSGLSESRTSLRPRTIAFFIVGWDKLASSVSPPARNVANDWWACAAKRHWSHRTCFADPIRRLPCLRPGLPRDSQTPRNKKSGFRKSRTSRSVPLRVVPSQAAPQTHCFQGPTSSTRLPSGSR